MNSVSFTTTTFRAWTTNQNIIPPALKHFIRQQQQLEVWWVRHAAAFSWSVESCRVCMCIRARETHPPPDGFIRRLTLKGFYMNTPSGKPNIFL